jgi:hypothetical protein
MSDVASSARNARVGLRIWDGACWVLAIPVAAWLRYEGDLSGAERHVQPVGLGAPGTTASSCAVPARPRSMGPLRDEVLDLILTA